MSADTVEAPAVFTPVWESLFESWTWGIAKANEWRTYPDHEASDLVSEGYLIFARCAERYVVKDRAHFFALYKTAFTRYLIDLSKRRRRRQATMSTFTYLSAQDAETTFDPRGQSDGADQRAEYVRELAELVEAVPEPMRALLKASLGAELPTSAPTALGSRRATRADRLAAAAGLPKEELPGIQEKLELWAEKYLKPQFRRRMSS